MILSEALNGFDDALYSEVSPNTRRWYAFHLRSLIDVLGGDTAVSTITTADLRQWRRVVFERPNKYGHTPSIPTQNGYIKSAKRFFGWLFAEGEIASNPAIKLSFVRDEDRTPKAISLDDFLLLVNHLAERGRLRDLAIIYVMLDTGCRVETITTLQLDAIEWEHRRAWTVEKGRKGRWIYFQPVTLHVLNQYLQQRPPVDFPELFISQHKCPFTRSGIWYMLRNAGKRAGCSGPVNPHSFRHAAAIEWLKRGMNLSAVSELLGHSNVTITHRHYARWEESPLQEQHRQHSPLNALGLDLRVGEENHNLTSSQDVIILRVFDL